MPDRSVPLRRIRLLGQGVVYRLEAPGEGQRVYRDMDAIPIVVCATPPCEVWLPNDVSLAVQQRGRNFALGQLTLPPGPGTATASIAGRGRRIVAGVVMVATTLSGLLLFVAGASEDPDATVSFQPVFNGLGGAVILGGLVGGGIMLSIPRRGVVRWRGSGAGRGWH